MLTIGTNRIAKSLSLALMLLALAPGTARSQTNSPAPAATAPPPSHSTPPAESDQIEQRWMLSGLILVLLGIGAIYLMRKPQTTTGR